MGGELNRDRSWFRAWHLAKLGMKEWRRPLYISDAYTSNEHKTKKEKTLIRNDGAHEIIEFSRRIFYTFTKLLCFLMGGWISE